MCLGNNLYCVGETGKARKKPIKQGSKITKERHYGSSVGCSGEMVAHSTTFLGAPNNYI
jgi:hypothetical protein